MEANAIAYSQAAYAANRASLLPKQPQKFSVQSGSRFQSPMLLRQSNLCRTQIVACKPTFLVQKCNGFAGKSLSSLAWGSSQFLRKPEDRPLAAQIRVQLKRCNKRFSFKPTAAVSGDAAAVPGDAGKTETEGGIVRTLQLGALFGMWYLFNIYFNIYNKQVLKVFPFPVTITELQFLIGSVVVLFMWTTGLYKKPNLTKSQLLSILPLAMVHTLGNLFTNMSLGKVAVSFTHTIKAMEPFFSVLLSTLVLGEVPNPLVLASLVPIVGGVALASITEASFNWAGFLSAMASNVTFQSRNVLSKKFMVKKEGSLDNINLFSVITIMSFFLLAPVALLSDGVRFTPANLKAAGLDVNVVVPRALMAGLCFHSYQQVSYMILQRVSPVTHSVGNCVKRVVVIVTSVLFFKTPVSPINALGTGVALAGVFGYSRIKQIKPKKAA